MTTLPMSPLLLHSVSSMLHFSRTIVLRGAHLNSECCSGLELQVDEGTVALMKEHYSKRGTELNASRLRMATLPTPSEVQDLPVSGHPSAVTVGQSIHPQ